VKFAPAEWPTSHPSGAGRTDGEIRRPLVRILRGEYIRPPVRIATPDQTDLGAVRRWIADATGPTAVDLFSGAGGLSLGLHDAGFNVLVGADSDAPSLATHSANLGSLGYLGDLSDSRAFLRRLRSWGISRVDLVAGGVPCQPFSRAGRSKIRSLVDRGQRPNVDPRAGLWRSFVEIVAGLRPRAVLLENVPDLTAWNDGAVIAGICDSLSDLGYRTDAMLLNAFEYGVPQHRSRLVIVAVRPGLTFEWPEKSERTTVGDAIKDLPVVGPAQRIERLPYQRPVTQFQQRLRRGVAPDDSGWVFDHITRDVRADDAEAFALLTEGQTYADLPPRLQRYRSDIFDDKYKRLCWSGLSRSITAHIAKDGYWYIHPDQDRTLSVREAARIQSFPDWFRFAGRPSERYRQIGNAVPPLLAEAVGRQLMSTLARPETRGRPRGPSNNVRAGLLRWHADHSRHIPWRESDDPWQVAIGERCLGRARPDEARRLFPAVTQAMPDPRSLAASPAAVAGDLRRLGVRGGVSDLVEIASAIVERHGGQVPSSMERLRDLPHVGQWLASAILVYGWGRRAVVLDHGSARVAARLRGETKYGRWQARIDLRRLAGKAGPDATFNAAVEDLAVLVCTPRSPACGECPLRRHCRTAEAGPGRPARRPSTGDSEMAGRSVERVEAGQAVVDGVGGLVGCVNS
jgi:DNA (cytosine-5)-methyltransferase 1